MGQECPAPEFEALNSEDEAESRDPLHSINGFLASPSTNRGSRRGHKGTFLDIEATKLPSTESNLWSIKGSLIYSDGQWPSREEVFRVAHYLLLLSGETETEVIYMNTMFSTKQPQANL